MSDHTHEWEWTWNPRTGGCYTCLGCPLDLVPVAAEERLNELEQENEYLRGELYGPAHDGDCPALQGAGPCNCYLSERRDEWRRKRLFVMEVEDKEAGTAGTNPELRRRTEFKGIDWSDYQYWGIDWAKDNGESE